MNETLKPNKYAGYCGCGKKVEAGAGFYNFGTFCQTPTELNYCPTEAASLKAAFEIKRAHEHAVFMETFVPVADGICDKCGGDGKYVYANGAIGGCYQCNGTGKQVA